ncbi:MAG: hypothetical protein IKD42_01410, partial [Kiritimatiellae bacterium]|nr:hypothetical protein [Kiritimatiellia bacterium]
MKNARQGSALLVVLGLMAFLSISALAFASFMRYARAPSSYTRRTAAARNLVKAAFARAVDAIDKGINDHPHPNLVSPRGADPLSNTWLDRVYTVTNDVSGIAEGDTVTPLTLEALAYVPPYLVNTLRWYSRRSPTAMWKTLDYDAGRYVYAAVDISDYLDINRILANRPRSSAPHTRFSLSYLFEHDGSENFRSQEHKAHGEKTADWDTWMENFREVDEDTRIVSFKSKIPLISIADFNMAMGKRGKIEPFLSPFCEFVTKNEIDAFDNTTYAEGGKTYADLRRMTICTDGLFPRKEKVEGSPDGKAHDLNDAKCQPFQIGYLKEKNHKLSDAFLGVKLNDDFNNAAGGYNILSGLGCAALLDYLDEDHLPVSLAVPTTERIPMICGIQTTLGENGIEFVTLDTEPAGGIRLQNPKVVRKINSNTQEVEVKLSFKLSPAFARAVAMGDITTLVCFPFSHRDEADSKSFSLDGRLSFFFADGDVPLRPLDPSDKTPHLEKRNIDSTPIREGLVNVKLLAGDVFRPTDLECPLKSEEETVRKFRFTMRNVQSTLGNAFKANGNELLRVTLRWTQTKTGGDWEPSYTAVWTDIIKGGKQYLSAIKEAH